MHIVYRNGIIKFISKDDYDPNKAKSKERQPDNIFVRIFRASGKRVQQEYDETKSHKKKKA